MHCTRVLLVVVVACLAAAPGARGAKGDRDDAHRARAAASGDRADARAFAAATKQFRAAVLAQKEPLETGVNRLTRDPVCLEAIRHVPRDEKPFSAAVALVFQYGFEAQVAPLAPAWTVYAESLARVRVRDPVLRSGRAAQRRAERVGRLVQPAPADICAKLDAWRQAGYPADAAPVIDDPAFEAAAKLPKRDQKRVERAGRRLRELGVSRRVVRLWNGDDKELFKGIDLHTGEIPVGEASG